MLKIWEADLNTGANKREVTSKGIINPVAIAVDWIGMYCMYGDLLSAYQGLVIIHVCSCAKKLTYVLTLNF